jgi:ERF superfamily
MEKKQQLATGGSDVTSFIGQAVASGAPVETLERLFALREKVKAEAAQEAFVKAMAQFQSECPVIEKTKVVLNKDGRTERYRFAPIGSIAEQIKVPLGKAGLSYSWDVKNEPKSITTICTVTHELGHSKTSTLDIPIDADAYMSAPQRVASAMTFGKRQTLCNALGISTGDEDTDATDVGKEVEAKSEKAKIMFLLRSLNKKCGNKQEAESSIKELTKLTVDENNLDEIISRLELLVSEQHENATV